MAEFPALQLWTDAYLGDTTHLTTIEHGAYLLLLMTAWRTRDVSLPDDDKLLARYARMNAAQWGRIKPTIAAFFTISGGVWRQSRLTDEAKAVRQKRESQSRAGKASALKRKGRHATDEHDPFNGRATTTATATATAIEVEESEPPTPVGTREEIASVVARCGRAAGVDVGPNDHRKHGEAVGAVREWIGLGLDPDTEIIPAIEDDARRNDTPRYSLKYFSPLMARIAARKDANAKRSTGNHGPTVLAGIDFVEGRTG